MARRRRTRKKKNPTTAQKIVLAVGGAVSLGLVGYGIYLAVKKPPPSLPPDALGGGGPTAPQVYNVIVRRVGDKFQGMVVYPNGRRMSYGGPQSSYQAAYQATANYITAVLGGTVG